jgi:exonuclease III
MRTLRISSWNVNGIFRKSSDYSKLDDNDFIDSVRTSDIFGMLETHTGPEDNIHMNKYHSYQVNRPKADNACRYSGGLAVLIKNDIKMV